MDDPVSHYLSDNSSSVAAYMIRPSYLLDRATLHIRTS